MIDGRELYRPIPGTRGYWVDAEGTVIRVYRKAGLGKFATRHKVLRLRTRRNSIGHDRGRPRHNFLRLDLWLTTGKATVARARLVAWAWLGPQPDGRLVCHRNGIETDDRLANLYYGSPTDNNADTAWHAVHPGEPRPGAGADPEDSASYADDTEAPPDVTDDEIGF